jgi:GTPase KRas protein
MLIGNKSDRATEREISVHGRRELAQKLGCGFRETSAKDYIAVDDAFYEVVRQLRRQRMYAVPQKVVPIGG